MEAAHVTAPVVLRRPAGAVLLKLRSDEQLLARFRAGDELAFEVLHDRYRARLLAYVRPMLGGSTADAEDALQDVLLRAHTTLRADDRPVAVRAWLYRVAHNRCIDHLRRPVVRDAPGELPESLASAQDPAREAEAREDLRRLVEDIGRLPEQQRSALLMRELEGLSHLELADALEVSVPAVKSLLVRARIGLTEARLARDTDCREVQEEVADAHDRGARPPARSRRHLRDCEGCRRHREALRGVERGLAALAPAAGPWAGLAKLLGLGGAASGGGGAALLGGGGAATATTVTVAAGAGAGAAVTGTLGTAKLAAIAASAAALVGGTPASEAPRERAAAPAHHAAAVVRHASAAAGGPAVSSAAALPPGAAVHRALATVVPAAAAVASHAQHDAAQARARRQARARAAARSRARAAAAQETAAVDATATTVASDATSATGASTDEATATAGTSTGTATTSADATTAASAGSVLAPADTTAAAATAATTTTPASAATVVVPKDAPAAPAPAPSSPAAATPGAAAAAATTAGAAAAPAPAPPAG